MLIYPFFSSWTKNKIGLNDLNKSKDKYNLMTSTNMGKFVDPIDKKFIDYYKRENPVRISIDSVPSSHDLATVTCGTNWEWKNLKEQDSFSFLVNQIDQAINSQYKGGNLICKVFETFTITMNKLIYLLTGYYDKVYIDDLETLKARIESGEFVEKVEKELGELLIVHEKE